MIDHFYKEESMKYLRIKVLIAVVLVLLVSASVSLAQDDVFRVAVVAPSATDDLAFSQSMYDAMMTLQESMGEDKFQFTFQDGTFVVDDAAAAMRDWASSGDYDLIIGHGSQYGAIIEELAPEFPETSFAWGTDVNTFGLDNVYAYTVAAEEGGYINGAVAAGLSKTGVMGVVGPIEVGDAKLYVDGFKAGAEATNPDITVNVTYIQSFSDVTLATEAANALVENDADVLTGTAQMVVGPIAVAIENDIPWFGTQSSQAELAAASGVSFQVYKWDVILEDMIAAIKDGKLGGEAYTLTLENGGIVMELSDMAFGGDADVIAATQEQIDTLSAGIISGDIVVFPEEEMDMEATATPAA